MAEQNATNIVQSGILLASIVPRDEQATAPKKASSIEVKGQRSQSPEKSESASNVEPKALPRPLGDVSLKFEIDSETHDVTILLLDRTSQRVVRTIPPDEMAKLNPGELLQLFI